MTHLDHQRDAAAPPSVPGSRNAGLGWLLTAFTRDLPSVAHAIAVSADGLALAASEDLPTDRADQLAAMTCGLASLTDGAARCLGAGPVSHTLVEMHTGVLFVMAIDSNAHLVVLVRPGSDLGQIGFETAVLAKKVGSALSPTIRTAADL